MNLFELKQFSFQYPEQTEYALHEVTLTLRQGDFLVLCGPSGCGKSTLLRQLKPVLAAHGTASGTITFCGTPLSELTPRQQAAEIGFVQQSPEDQIVTDKVWHELAFGLESLGFDTPTIRRRVAEMASFFGIQEWFSRDVAELSGGQKQLLNLAAVMVMQPKVLILDEPTSQLDPIAASDFLAMLGRLNRELGTTVLLTEHRLEEALPLANRVAVLENGSLLCAGTADEVGCRLRESGNTMFFAMPSAMRVWASVDSDEACPVTVRDGRDFLNDWCAAHPALPLPTEHIPPCGAPVLTAEGVWFSYEKERPDVVKGLDLQAGKGEFLALLGGNGTGKTTTLKLLAGLLKPYRGEVRATGAVALLPQDPQTVFVKKTLREDLFEVFDGRSVSREMQTSRVERAVAQCGLAGLLDRHPYDLSGGEQQRAALCKLLLLEPDILLLDEPTKGLDAGFKRELAHLLRGLSAHGVTIVMVSHDIEFCACYAHRCALFFDGNIVAQGTPRAFFSGNSFYTTSANRMAREHFAEAVTPEDVMTCIGGILPAEPPLPEPEPLPAPAPTSADWKPKKLPWWRKTLAALSGTIAFVLLFYTLRQTDLTALIGPEIMQKLNAHQAVLYAVFIAAMLLLVLSIGRRTPPIANPRQKRRLRRRTLAATAMILLLIPLTLYVGLRFFGNQKYYFTSLLVLLECMLPFFLVFEGRKPQARELVLIAVLSAMAVAGRAAFFMLPQFKPVMALTIISGVALGGETGFLVGAMSMLLSNIFFSQGPWTPYQMFSMGIIGFLAGVLFRKGLLRRSRGALAVFGGLSAIVIYGGIMNPVSALLWTQDLNWKILLSYYISGFPMDCVHAAATVLFLLILAEPMLEKLDRIKTKYGLIE